MRSEAPPRTPEPVGSASLGQCLIARAPRGRAVALAGRVRLLTASEWVVLAESAVLAVGIEAALRLLPLARVLDGVHGRRAGTHASNPDRAGQERLARLARWPFKVLPLPGSCLRIALVQVAVLRRRGVPATVRFGVRRGAGDLEFHAWAEYDGPIDDHAAAAGYRSFEPVPVTAISRNARWSWPAAPPDGTV